MCNNGFVHLHVHTDSSLKDGMTTPHALVEHAKSLGFGRLAITDHGTLSNAVQFSQACDWVGIDPILGIEGYIEVDGQVGHITLLADGQKGWGSLVDLNNLAQESNHKNPTFTLDQLLKNSDGLVCLSGCVASPIHKMSNRDSLNLTLQLQKVFGDRFWLELMFNSAGDSFSRPMWLHEKTGIPYVITNDVHFPQREMGQLHKHLTRLKSGFDYESSDLWLKPYNEMYNSALRYGATQSIAETGLSNAAKLGKSLGIVSLKREPKLPVIEDEKLQKFLVDIYTKAAGMYESGKLQDGYLDRLQYELSVIQKMGFLSYFYILNDVVDYARQNNVLVGPGRGSGAGSLVLFVLGITAVNPVKYGLEFERFLNPERVSMPDVDIDFSAESRDRVLDYATNKWNASPIATYSTYSEKSLIRELLKYFKAPQPDINKAADQGVGGEVFKKYATENPDLKPLYDAMLGQKRHKGKHAAGMVITDIKIPLERAGDKLIAGWAEGGKNAELGFAGVVKFDFLGISSLSALERMRKMSGVEPLPAEEDPKPFELFRSGDLSGIFQFSGSEGIKNLTLKLQPETIEDLCAINALYRPGAIDSGTTEKYPDWKRSPRIVPDYISDIVTPTYGGVIYQEQFMKIYARTVDGNLADADIVRRLLAKAKKGDPKWEKEFSECREKFIKGGIAHGLSENQAANLWHELETHAGYSFNKSHSMAYAFIAWMMAWYKYYYPEIFYCSLLNTDADQVQTYMFEAAKRGINIHPPSLNNSTAEYEYTKDGIFMPLTSVKFMGLAGANYIVQERQTNGPFTSIENFMKRVSKKLVKLKAREGLFVLGGMDGLSCEGDAYRVLGLKEEPEKLDKFNAALKYFGFYLPNKKMVELIEAYENVGGKVGVIQNVDMRTNARGKYAVYTLEPKATFWSFEETHLQKGELVAVKIWEKNGKLLRAKRLKI